MAARKAPVNSLKERREWLYREVIREKLLTKWIMVFEDVQKPRDRLY